MVQLIMGGADDVAGTPAVGDGRAAELSEQRVSIEATDPKPSLPTDTADPRATNGPGVKLTEFLDLATLQDIQDSLAMVAQVKASVPADQWCPGHPKAERTEPSRLGRLLGRR